MEYRNSKEESFHKVTGTSVTGLDIGTYEVRYPETELYKASPSAEYTIVSTGKENQDPLILKMSSEVVYGDEWY